MPYKLTRTTPANLPWGRSVKFNGTNQYLTAGAASNWTFLHNGSSWTAECWFNVPSASLSSRYTLISTDAASAFIGMDFNLNNTSAGDASFYVYKGVSGQWPVSVVTSGNIFTPNTWNHIAAVYNSGTSTGTIYMNGVAVASSGSAVAFSTSAPTYTLAIGRYQFSTPAGYLNGYISNLRIANSVLYTASFTPLNSPLNVVASASLLACHDTSIKDGSVNNFAITNNNSATVSTATPFVVSTKSVFFNGINQRLTVPNNAAFQFGTGDFTIECWMYCRDFGTLATTYNRILCVGSTFMLGTGTGAEFVIYASSSNTPGGVTYNLAGNTGNIGATISSGTSVMDTNRWYHLAMTRQSGTMYGFIDGGLLYSVNNTASVSGTSGVSIGGALGATSYFSGSISNVRIVKGTALYTASFTAPTAPLTSVASCSLLTCNAATIVDSSNNNFTITNNGSATVSTVIPFNVVGYGYKFNSRSVATTGTQKAIFGYGDNGGSDYSITNLVSNTGVVSTDTTGVGTARRALAAAGYGSDKAIFGYGYATGVVSMTNLVSNTGVVSTDTTGVGTARKALTAAGYGSDKAIFGYGQNSSSTNVSMTNLVSNAGVVATDTSGIGTARNALAASRYGADKAIFGYGYSGNNFSTTNLVGNTGVVATNTTGVGTARSSLAAAGYGGDKAIFGYGYTSVVLSMTNLVSNTGVVATDTTGVGTAREQPAAAGYSVNIPTTGGMKFKKSSAIVSGTQKAIFGYGNNGAARYSITNLVSNTGVVASNTTGVGTSRHGPAAAGYGSDKAIFGYGYTTVSVSMTNLVSNTGVVSTDTTGVGTARQYLAAAGYGSDKAIFGYGSSNVTNLVSNTGVVATDTTGVGTSRSALAAAGYGTDKAIFGYGTTGTITAITNLVSNTGVVATDTTGVGTSRSDLAAAGYGSDKAIFGYGGISSVNNYSMTNLVSNTGVVATDTTGVGTTRLVLAAAGYGTDKAIFGYGQTTVALSMTNLVSNTGVVATDTAGVGTARNGLAAAGFSLS